MGAKPEEDPQKFIDEIGKALRVIHATEIEAVELASYRLKDVASSWYKMWEESHGNYAPPGAQDEFTEAFIDKFLPIES